MFGRISKTFTKRIDSVPQPTSGSGYSSLATPAAPTPTAATSSNAGPVFKDVGGFYFKPEVSSRFELLSSTQTSAQIFIYPTVKDSKGRQQFKIVVVDEDDAEPALEQDITNVLGMTFYHDSGAVMWHCVFDSQLRELCFRFVKGGDASRRFIDCYNSSVYASYVEATVDKDATDDDRAYVQSTYTNERPIRASSPEPQAPESTKDSQQEEELFTFSARDRSVVPLSASKGTDKNLVFADSVQYSRAIVLRETSASGKKGVEVRAIAYDTAGGFAGAGEAFALEDEMAKLVINCDKDNQSLLSHDDKHMYALHDKGGIIDVDLSQGAVVTEYKPNEKYKTLAITNQSKFANNDPYLMSCLASNVAFTIDKRLDPSRCVVAEEGKDTSDYALSSLKTPFTCSATSAKGQLVIGDSIGNLRLYGGTPGSRRAAKGDAHPKTAKTLLKGTAGNGIVSIDITADGKYVVAATNDSVLVFPLEFIDGTKAANGCDARMGKNKKEPLRLVPTATQLVKLGGKLNFTRVRFDADPKAIGDQSAKWIVATSGDTILTWKMDAVVNAVETKRAVQSDAATEEGTVKQIDVTGGGDKITFMTDASIGAERRSSKPVRKGFSYLHF